MSEQIQLNILIGLLTILATLSGIFIGHLLERQRKKEELLFQERKEIYAKILAGMSSSFLPENKDAKEALEDSFFKTNARLKMGNLFSQGRLITGNSSLSNK